MPVVLSSDHWIPICTHPFADMSTIVNIRSVTCQHRTFYRWHPYWRCSLGTTEQHPDTVQLIVEMAVLLHSFMRICCLITSYANVDREDEAHELILVVSKLSIGLCRHHLKCKTTVLCITDWLIFGISHYTHWIKVIGHDYACMKTICWICLIGHMDENNLAHRYIKSL